MAILGLGGGLARRASWLPARQGALFGSRRALCSDLPPHQGSIRVGWCGEYGVEGCQYVCLATQSPQSVNVLSWDRCLVVGRSDFSVVGDSQPGHNVKMNTWGRGEPFHFSVGKRIGRSYLSTCCRHDCRKVSISPSCASLILKSFVSCSAHSTCSRGSMSPFCFACDRGTQA